MRTTTMTNLSRTAGDLLDEVKEKKLGGCATDSEAVTYLCMKELGRFRP
jgi:hypothetical protein